MQKSTGFMLVSLRWAGEQKTESLTHSWVGYIEYAPSAHIGKGSGPVNGSREKFGQG